MERKDILKLVIVATALWTSIDVSIADQRQRHALRYKGNQAAWRFVNKPWDTNEAGDLIVPGRRNIGVHLAFNTERAYRDCAISGKFQMSWVPFPQLIVRAEDSRRFYAVLFSLQADDPRPSMVNVDAPWLEPIMVSIWKGGADGYQRILAYRRKASYVSSRDRERWYEARVECVGSEIIVFLDGNFILAFQDDEYQQGVVGVGSMFQGGVWRGLEVEGQPVEMDPTWKLMPELPQALKLTDDLPSLDRSFDLPRLGERWKVSWDHKPGIVWNDRGTNFDQLTADNFWINISRSKDGGKTWSEKEKANLPFPEGRAYGPLGNRGAALVPSGRVAELSDGAIGWSLCWANGPDGHYQATQVLFYRSTDGGKSWSASPVDGGDWERNESQWVELQNGELLCTTRSNMNTYLGVSRSKDMGRTWSRIRPALPFYGANAGSLMLTRENVLLLACRGWGVFTSVDNGHTWNMPTQISGYTGGGWEAQMKQLADGRIVIGGNERPDELHLFTVDRQGVIHPAE